MRLINKIRRSVKQAIQGARAPWMQTGFSLEDEAPVSDHMLTAVDAIRGNHPPALFIHGVLPRSGTVYVGRLIKEHPDVAAYPREIWEMPLLNAAPAVETLQDSFIAGYKKNHDKFAENDFQALVGAAFVAYLYAQTAGDQRLLMKVPLVRHMSKFQQMFPREQCLLLLRDGRDLTASTMKSWASSNFRETVTAWRDAAAMMLELPYPLYRYEDIVANPHDLVRDICMKFGLDPERYPYDTIASQPLKGSSEHVQDAGWDGVEKSQTFTSVGRWESWSNKEKDLFKSIAGEQLIQAGYAESLDW